MRPCLLLVLIAGCAAPTAEAPQERVELVLSTTRCPPDDPPDAHQFATEDLRIAWTTLCTRDGRSIAWQAVKVSYWEDRAEDLWNLWYVDPAVDELVYGQDDVPGVDDPLNDDFPFAWRRVPPAPLPPGDYRVEVWALQDDSLDAQQAEIRVTVLETP